MVYSILGGQFWMLIYPKKGSLLHADLQDMSPELNEKLEKMSREAHATKTDILKKATFLMDIAMDILRAGTILSF